MSGYHCLSLGIWTPQMIASLCLGILGLYWVIFLSLGWHLASFQAWKYQKKPEECWFSCLASWQVSLTFADGQVTSPSPRARRRRGEAKVSSFLAYQVNIGHLSYESKWRDRLIPRHSQTNERAHDPRITVWYNPTWSHFALLSCSRNSGERIRTNRISTKLHHEGLSELLWCLLLDRWWVDLIPKHACFYPSPSNMCKDIYNACHCSCRLVKLTACIHFPLTRSFNISRLATQAALARKSLNSLHPLPPLSFEHQLYICQTHRALDDTWHHYSNRFTMKVVWYLKQHHQEPSDCWPLGLAPTSYTKYKRTRAPPRGYHLTKFRFKRWWRRLYRVWFQMALARLRSGFNRVLSAAEHGWSHEIGYYASQEAMAVALIAAVDIDQREIVWKYIFVVTNGRFLARLSLNWPETE